MKKWLYVVAIAIVSCSDDKGSGEAGCNVERTTLDAAPVTWTYTGGSLILTGENICAESIQSVTLNGTEAEITAVTSTSIQITVPVIEGDSAVVTVDFGSSDVTFDDKIAVYPGKGTWQPRAAFPGAGRYGMFSFTSNGKGYIVNGEQYTGATEEGYYEFDRYSQVYEYDAEANAWQHRITDDRLVNIYYATVASGKLFYLSNDMGSFTTRLFNLTSNAFSTVKTIALTDGYKGFTANGAGYFLRNIANKTIEIIQYNEAEDQWTVAQSASFGNDEDYFYFQFAFEHNGSVYFGSQMLNSDNTTLWKFDPANNTLDDIGNFNTPSGLKYLFTIGQQAYFMGQGESSISPTQAEISAPEEELYIYNFAAGEWFTVPNDFPPAFFGVASFTIGNRGFAGLGNGVSTGANFSYPTTFYEFVPE